MKKAIILLLSCLTFGCISGQNKNDIEKYTSQKPQYGFIENKGQIYDQDYKANPGVKYLLCLGNGMNVQLKANSFSYDTYRTEIKEKEKDALADKMRPNDEPEKDITYYFHRVDVELLGANANPQIIAEEPSAEYLNYYNSVTPESGATNVRHYKKITYKDIYPGIDLVFVALGGKEKPVEYSFIVHAGADAGKIKLHYVGANKTQLTQNQIHVTIAHGGFTENIPASWLVETKAALDVQYKNIEKDIYGFAIPDYNKNQTLIIDPNPNLDWGTYYGGSGGENGGGITCDGSGNVYITGFTSSADGIATSGAYQATFAGNPDAFVVKFNSSGVRQWGTYYGGIQTEYGRGISCDGSGNVFITGLTSSTSGIATSGAHQTTFGGYIGDAFIVKFNSSGVRQWGTYYGGSNVEQASGITCDGSGNVFITGNTSSTTGIASTGAYQNALNGSRDVFIVKFNSSGVRQWGTYYGGSGEEGGGRITCDGSGNVFISGSTQSNDGIATAGAHQTTYGGSGQIPMDAFIVKFSSSGVRQWGTYYGGSGYDAGFGISCDGTGNVFMTGYTESTAAIASTGAHQTIFGGSHDAFLVKFTSSGVRLWGTYYGGCGDDNAFGTSCDGSGNIFITGETESTTGIATTGAYQIAINDSSYYDAFVVKFNSSGVRQWGTYYGGSDYEIDVGITCDGSGNVIIKGNTASSAGIATTGAYQTTICGSSDAFVAKFSTCDVYPADAGIISGNSIIYQGQNSIVYTIPVIADATSYIWTLPGGVTGTSSTNSITVNCGLSAVSGNITVCGTNSCGNGSASSLPISVKSYCQTEILNFDEPFGTRSWTEDGYSWSWDNTGWDNIRTYTPHTGSGHAMTASGYASKLRISDHLLNIYGVWIKTYSASNFVYLKINGYDANGILINSINLDPYSYQNSYGYILLNWFSVKSIKFDYDKIDEMQPGEVFYDDIGYSVVILPDSAGTISGLTSVCQGVNDITYTVSAIANATSYIWTLPGGATGTSTTNSITVSYDTSAISGNIIVKGHNSCGDGAASTMAITVNPFAAAPLIETIIQPTCAVSTGSIVLNGLPLPGTWIINPGNITGSGISYTLSGLAAGTYNYTVNNGFCTSAVSSDVVINAQPVTPSAPIIGTITQPSCAVATGSVLLSGLPSSGTWTLTRSPGGTTTTGTGTSTTLSGIPSGTYTYTVSNGSCTSVASGMVVIMANPGMIAGAASSSPSVCVNTTISPVTHTTTGATGIGAASSLPAGVTAAWAANTITISGTPTAAGTFNYTIPLTGGCGAASATGTITVVLSNAITLSSAVGSDTQTLCINTAITNITYSTSGATGADILWLPSGVTGNWASNIVTISGTPSTNGTFNYSILLSGGCGPTVFTNGTITVLSNSTISMTSAAGTNAQTKCINTAIANITYATSGASGATITGLPTGVTGAWASNVVTISGTPTVSGTYTYTVALTGGCSDVSATGTITVTPNNTITLTSAAGTNAQTKCINTAITNIYYTSTGATGAIITGLPAGVTGSWASNVVTISGTPTATGTFYYTVTMAGGCTGGTNTATGTITVKPNNTITLTSVAGTNAQTRCINTAITNITYATTTATGATVTDLPTGVTGNWASNIYTISGTPAASGTYTYTVTLTGGCGNASATGTITVAPNNGVTTASSSPTLCINTPLTVITHATTGATGIDAATGLPAGVTAVWAANTITISGTPTAAGTFHYTIPLTGGCGTVNATGTITVKPNNTITLVSGGSPSICITNSIPGITYSTTGATGATFGGLPAGVTGAWAANTVTISGTPTATGTFTYTLTLTGGCGTMATTGTIAVVTSNTIVLSSAMGTNAQTKCINTAIANITYATSGASDATINGLPTGVTGAWASNVVTVSGTATVTGTYNYTVTLTGGCGNVSNTGTITVTPNNTVTSASSTQTLCIDTPLNAITHTTVGATGIGAATGLPAGVTATWASNTITITGTPTVSGIFNYIIPLTGGCGAVNATGTITVTPNNTISLTSAGGTNTQTRCINTAITNITYATTGATGAIITGLPAGVTGNWASNVLTISGTPTASGVFTYTVTLTGGCGSVSNAGTITVTPNNTISLTAGGTQTICINTAITTTTYTTTGATGADILWLPSGVTGNWASNIVTISGTPSTNGTFNYSILLSGGCGNVFASGTITVLPNNTISLTSATGTNAQTKCINTAITNITYSTSGATGATISGLPAGVTGSWSSNNVTISGTPYVTGVFTYTVTLIGGCGTLSTTGTITVNPNNTIALTSAAGTNTQTNCANTAITNITYSTSGATGATISGLPTGVTGSWTSNVVTISGTPTATGTFNYSVTMTGGCTGGTNTATGTITVTPNNTITLTSAAGTNAQTRCINTAIANITYATTTALGATVTGLPTGVAGNWASNVVTISGTPTATGTFYYTVTMVGGCTGGTNTATGTITVKPNNTITLTSAAGTNAQTRCINTAITNITYATTTAAGATISGLPAGVTGSWSSNTVTISGTPSVAGVFTYTVALSGGCGTVTATGTIVVNVNNTIVLTSAAGTNAQTKCVNTAITNITYSTTGATGAVFTGLPTGVAGNWASNVVTISGTPTVTGTFNYTVTMAGGCTGGTNTATGTLSVRPNNTITLSSAPGTNNQAKCINTPITNITYSTTGATGAVFTGLPAGVTGSWASNVVTISGTPTATGVFNFTIILTGGCSVSAIGTITVIPNNTITFTSASGTNAQTRCINTAIANITYATTTATGATVTGLPTGVTGNWASNVVTISGTPTATGTFNYTVTMTGGCQGGTNSTTGTLCVMPNNTITLTSGSGTNNQTKCINTPITNINYSTTGATGATVTGLPTGVTGSWASNVITIIGTPTAAGTFNYSVIMTGGCAGATNTATGTITVNALPAGAGAIYGPTAICQGESSATYTVPVIPNSTSYIWTLPPNASGTSSTNSINVNFGASPAPGNITVKGYNSCGYGASSSLNIKLCCKNEPDSLITANYGFFNHGCLQQPYNNLSHCKWLIFPNAAESIFIKFHIFDIKEGDKIRVWDGPDTTSLLIGSYDITSLPPAFIQTGVPMFVELITNDTLVGDGFYAEYWTNITADISQISMIDNIKIYPNPATHTLTIEAPGESLIEIVNIEGQLIQCFTTENNLINTDVSGFSAGMYFVKVRTGRGVVVEKFVKE